MSDIFTIHLTVKAIQQGGPDTEWEEVAGAVARQIDRVSVSLRNGAGFDLIAEVDTAGDESEDGGAAKPERKYVLTSLGSGDYLLPGNNGKTLWRIFRATPGWEIWRWRHQVGENAPAVSEEWADWDHVQSHNNTRAEAISEALRIEDV